MRRGNWRFEYAAGSLSEAAEVKMRFHDKRLEWWKDKRREVMATIRSEGIEMDERISLEYAAPKARDWERGAKLSIRDDLRTRLLECQDKLMSHTQKRREFNGWMQVLKANPELTLRLDIEDWLFFFDRN